MTALRTIQIVNVRWFNATAWYGLELSRLLNGAGHETLVLGLSGTESFEKAQSMGLNPHSLPASAGNPLTWPVLAPKLMEQIRRFKPHVINAHRGEGFALLGLLRKAGNFALVRTRGDQRLPQNTWPNRWLHGRVADAVVATNSRMARHFVCAMGIDSSRVHTILGGVDRRRFAFDLAGREQVRAQYGFGPEHCVFGLLGRFDTVKGQKETLAALSRLVAEGMDTVRLLLLGFPTDTSQAEVESWISEYGLQRHAFITGLVPQVTAYLSALDVGVVASLWSEAIARAALEIMACGVPLVSTSVGVMPDLLQADALCAPGDARAFAALLRRATQDTPWRNELQINQSVRMADLSSEDFLAKTLRVYAEALKRRQGHGVTE